MPTPRAQPSTPKHPELAVVAVTHNSGRVIEPWLAALDDTGRRAQMELCVVDSGSSADQRAGQARALDGRVEHLRECVNLGYGRSCNVGAALTSAPVLLFTNPDTLVRSLPENLSDATAGRLLGAFGVLPDGETTPLGFERYPTAAQEVRDLALGRWRRRIPRTESSPAWVSGAAILMARDDFMALGGFSPELFMYFEDADLCARHRQAGGSVALHHQFQIEHGHGASSEVMDRDALLSALDSVNRHSARAFAARHGRPWHRVALYVLMVVVYLPRRLATALLGRRGLRRRALWYVVDLLAPGRVMRRLGVPGARSAGQ